MEPISLFRLLLVFIHLMAFAVAAGYILREDVRFLHTQEIRLDALRETAWVVVRALGALWITGILLILIDTSGNLAMLVNQPKLLAKLTVVTVLTINGVLLHRVAFPTLSGSARRPASAAVTAIIGAISGVSWAYAAFIGIAKPLAGTLGYSGFIALYVMVLVVGITVALSVVRPKIERLRRMATAPTATI